MRRRSPPSWGAGLLALNGGLAFFCAYGWSQLVGSGSLATSAGLLLATSALAAPFLLVADAVRGPGPEARTLARVERIITRGDRRRRRLERSVVRHLAAAESRLCRAQEVLAAVADLLGVDHQLIAALTVAVRRLRDELDDGPRTGAVPPLDPDDLDLAG